MRRLFHTITKKSIISFDRYYHHSDLHYPDSVDPYLDLNSLLRHKYHSDDGLHLHRL